MRSGLANCLLSFSNLRSEIKSFADSQISILLTASPPALWLLSPQYSRTRSAKYHGLVTDKDRCGTGQRSRASWCVQLAAIAVALLTLSSALVTLIPGTWFFFFKEVLDTWCVHPRVGVWSFWMMFVCCWVYCKIFPGTERFAWSGSLHVCGAVHR